MSTKLNFPRAVFSLKRLIEFDCFREYDVNNEGQKKRNDVVKMGGFLNLFPFGGDGIIPEAIVVFRPIDIALSSAAHGQCTQPPH
jgi:hypothetical protein